MRGISSGAMAWVCAALGLAALAAAVASLWPSAGTPAWPGASLALVALAASCFGGDVRLKAPGTLCASTALVLMSVELTGLWALGKVLS